MDTKVNPGDFIAYQGVDNNWYSAAVLQLSNPILAIRTDKRLPYQRKEITESMVFVKVPQRVLEKPLLSVEEIKTLLNYNSLDQKEKQKIDLMLNQHSILVGNFTGAPADDPLWKELKSIK